MITRVQLTDQGRLRIFSKYNEELIAAIKAVPGHRFDKPGKYWEIPVYNIPELISSESIPQREKERLLSVFDSCNVYKNSSTSPPPLEFGWKYYPYQEELFKFLYKKGSGILNSFFGSGKTLISIAYAKKLLQEGKVDRVLYFTTKSLCFGAMKQIVMFFGDTIKFQVIDGNKVERSQRWKSGADMFILNYDLLNIDDDFQEMFRICNFSNVLIILDECTKVKNWKAKRTTNLQMLKAKHRVGLSGAPLENKLDELYNIVRVLGYNMFGGWRVFQNRYMVSDEWGRAVEYSHLDELKKKMSYIMATIRENDVLKELPEIVRIDKWIELSPEEHKEYTLIEDQLLNAEIAMSDDGTTFQTVLAWLTIARMYCDMPKLVYESSSKSAGVVRESIKCKSSSKLEFLLETLDEIEGNVLIFSQFSSMIGILEGLLKPRGKPVYTFTGATKDRQKVINDFNKTGGYFLSTDAGAYGVNLEKVRYLIHYDLPYNPAVVAQREGRVSGLRRKDTVYVIKLIVSDYDKVERRVKQILDDKKWLIGQVIGNEGDEE